MNRRQFIVWTKTVDDPNWEPSEPRPERKALRERAELRELGIRAKALPEGVRPGEDLPNLFVNPERMAEWADPT